MFDRQFTEKRQQLEPDVTLSGDQEGLLSNDLNERSQLVSEMNFYHVAAPQLMLQSMR